MSDELDYAGLDNEGRAFVVLPIEASGGWDHFCLIAKKKETQRETPDRVTGELLLRCLFCNYGYNCVQFVTVTLLTRLGQEAVEHLDRCPRTGRTLPLTSYAIGE